VKVAVAAVLELPMNTTKNWLSTGKMKQSSVDLFNNNSQGSDELSPCKTPRNDSWPVSLLVSYNNSSASNSSGLTLGQVGEKQDTAITTSDKYNVASSMLQLDK
jgi:hypothetical protein